MTRKDYVAIAAAVLRARNGLCTYQQVDPRAAISEVSCRIADVMAQDNPRFDRARFLQACGVQS